MATYSTQRISTMKMRQLQHFNRNSGAIRGGSPVAPSHWLIVCSLKKYFYLGYALSARPYRWPRKRFRDIIHVGLNTLSKAYQNMKQQITTVVKIVPVVLIMWVITFIIQNV